MRSPTGVVPPALGGLDQIFRFTEIGRDGGPFRGFGQISGVEPFAGTCQRGRRRFWRVTIIRRGSVSPSRSHGRYSRDVREIINTRHGFAQVASRRGRKIASKDKHFQRRKNPARK